MSGKWNVWSQANDGQLWVVVVESVSEAEAKEAEERKRAALAKWDVPGRVVALPNGQTP